MPVSCAPVVLRCGVGGEVSSAKINPEGTVVACAWSTETTIKLWDANDGRLIRTLEGHTAPVKAVCFSADGASLVSGGDDCAIKLWEIATGELIRTFKGHGKPVSALGINSNGSRLVSAGGNDTNCPDTSRCPVIILWDTATGNLLSTRLSIYDCSATIDSLQFNPAGDLIMSKRQHDYHPTFWDVSQDRIEAMDFENLNLEDSHPPGICCWNSSGTFLLEAYYGSLIMYDTATGRKIWHHDGDLPGYSFVHVCAGDTRIICARHPDIEGRWWWVVILV